MVSNRLILASLVFVFGLLVLGALAVSAQDDEAPEVRGPRDRPGADVIWEEDVEYELNASGSTDNVGIELYTWQIFCPNGTDYNLTSTTPAYKWAPDEPGIYKVVSWAEDAEGNKGFHVFAMDVYRVISSQTISDTSITYDYSVAVTNGPLTYMNTEITVTGGLAADAASVTKGEQLTEDIYFRGVGGKLAGHWEAYYPQYGDIYRDTTQVLTGKASIRNSGGMYAYGFKYFVDDPMDINDYDTLVFWLRGGYSSASFYYLYLRSGSGYGYRYYYIYPGSAITRGWWGVTVSLDWYGIGYGYDYGLDITSITCFEIYFYNYNTRCWIDCAYFAEEEFKDNITESNRPTGEWAGYWSGISFSTSTHRYVGSRSVRGYIGSGYRNVYYYWNNPVDLTKFNALRLLNYYPNYYYIRFHGMYFYDANGRYNYISMSGYWHMYASLYSGRWFLCNVGMDENMYSGTSLFDWTRVTRMRFYLYCYTTGYVNIDGLEFYQSQGAKAGKPTLTENIPHGIYALDDGELNMDRVNFASTSPFGSFVRCDNNMSIKKSTFDGLWGTTHEMIKNEGQTYGGILCFNAKDVLLDDVTITKAVSSGFYIENSNIEAKNLDLSGYSSGFDGAAGIIAAFAGTGIGETHTVKVTNSDFHDSSKGSGLLVLSQDARGNAGVTLEDVSAYKNGLYGVAMEVVGWTGNLTVLVKDSEFELNDGSGFAFVAHDAMATKGTKVRFTVETSDAIENGGYGYLFDVRKARLNAEGWIKEVETYDNSGNGLGFDVNSIAGQLTLNFEGVDSHENEGNGMYIRFRQGIFKDLTGTSTPATGRLNLDFDGCRFAENEGHGVYDQHYSSSDYSAAVRPLVNYRLVARKIIVEKNEGHGYYVNPYSNPQYCDRDARFEFYDSLFSDNNNAGAYFREYYQNSQERGNAREHVLFDNCTFTYNVRGIEQWWERYSYSSQAFVTLRGCTFRDNDYEAIWAHGDYNSYGGYTYMMGFEWDIQDSYLGGHVRLDPSGFYNYGSTTEWAKVTIINNTYTSDLPMFLRFTSYMYASYHPLEVTVIYKGNTHTSPSTGDGIHIEMYGGYHLKGSVTIEDQEINNPLGNGVYVRFGTLYRYAYRKSASGHISITDVDIRNPLESGIVIETYHYNPSGATSSGFYSLLRTNVQGADIAIRSMNFDGEIRQCSFTNLREETIYTYFGVIDVFESEVGEISQANLRVDEKGAIRLWFEMRVRVVWKGTTDPVTDANIEIKDNTWNIIGINTIPDSGFGVLFRNLNSYTVMAEGIFTKNPYIVTVDYLGIMKEARYEVAENMDVTIEIVDDISPLLTIEAPKDGHEQRETEVEVKGTVFDKHTGMDRVEVSIDNENWMEAEMSGDKFTYTHLITDIPEGLVLIRVRAYDTSGNMKEGAVSVLVDSTPPSLSVITPTEGMITNLRRLEIVGTTDVGADVYINDKPITLQYTLISHIYFLSEGPNAIKVSAVDYLGNINEIVRYVTLDTQAPYVDLVNVEDGTTVNTPRITVIGLTDITGATVMVAGNEVEINEEGRFELELELEEGPNAIEILARDEVGNERVESVTIILDLSPPWLKVVKPSELESTVKDIEVMGYVEQGSTVYVKAGTADDREVEVIFGYFETVVSAKEGDFELLITAIDPAGNVQTVRKTIKVDTIKPMIEVESPLEDYMTNHDTVEVRGSVTGTENEYDEEGRLTGFDLYVNGIPVMFDPVSGEFTHDVILEEGVNRITVKAVDGVGNDKIATRTVMLDSEAPYLSVFIGNIRTDPNWNEPVSLSDFVYVSGFTEIGSALTVNGVSVNVDPTTGSFNYSLELPAPVGGSKIATTEIHVTSTDGAGNTAEKYEYANRIEGVEVEKAKETSTAEWMVLILALIIFGLSFAGAIGYQRLQAQEELIESLEARPEPVVTPEGHVVAPPPARPARGGRARHKPEPPKPPVEEVAEEPEAEEEEEIEEEEEEEEDELIVDLDEEEEVD